MGGYEDVSAVESKLAEEVNEAILHSVFIPFGDIEDVKTPLDQATQKHRSFRFVTFLEREDATAAVDNMDGAKLYDRILTVNYTLPEHSQRRERRASGVRGRDGANPVAFLETGESFWVMRNDHRRERCLPGFFDQEVYEILDGAAELEAERTTEEEEEGKKPLTTKRENHLSVSLHPWEGSKEQGQGHMVHERRTRKWNGLHGGPQVSEPCCLGSPGSSGGSRGFR